MARMAARLCARVLSGHPPTTSIGARVHCATRHSFPLLRRSAGSYSRAPCRSPPPLEQQRWCQTTVGNSVVAEKSEAILSSVSQAELSGKPTTARQVVERLQEACLSTAAERDGAAGTGSAPLWQQCVEIVFSQLRAGSGRFSSDALVDMLTAWEAETHSGAPSTPQQEGEALTFTAEEVQRVLDWLLHACCLSDAPLPLTTAVYEMHRLSTQRARVPSTTAAPMRSGSSSSAASHDREGERAEEEAPLPVRIPWLAKGLHTCFARYLLEKWSRARTAIVAPRQEAQGNMEAFYLFESFFDCLLLDNAEDAALAGEAAQQGDVRVVRTVTTSAAQQLLLLEGLLAFLRYCRRIGDEKSNRLPALHADEFLLLSWLTSRTTSQHEPLANVEALARACLAKLAPTDAAQRGLGLYWAITLERRLLHPSHAEPGKHDARCVAQTDLLLRIASPASAAATPAQRRKREAVADGAEESGMEEERARRRPCANELDALVKKCQEEEEALRRRVSPAEASLLLCRSLMESATSPWKHTGASDDARRTGVLLDAFSSLVSALLHPRGVGEGDDSDAFRHFMARALLQPCQLPAGTLPDAGPHSTAFHRRPAFPLVLWFLHAAFEDVIAARRPMSHDASRQCVESLKTLTMALDGAVSYFTKKARSSVGRGRHARQVDSRRAKRQRRELQQGMQAFWFAILNATIDGVFCHGAVRDGNGPGREEEGKTLHSGGCPALMEVVLPFYPPRYWRRETVNLFVAALDAWGMSAQLRQVLTAIQRREEPLQQRVWHAVREHKKGRGRADAGAKEGEGHDTPQREGSDAPVQTREESPQPRAAASAAAAYHPALSLRSCDIIYSHCVARLRDPQAAAIAVKYITLSLRARQFQREIGPQVLQEQRDRASHAGKDDHDEVAVAEHAEDKAAEAEENARWLERVSSVYIPAVDALFVEKGIDTDGSWLEG